MKSITATQLRLARLNGNKDFEGFDLCGMELIEAGWLAGCNLRWTDLSCADLRGARLVGAKLRWANLETSDLRNSPSGRRLSSSGPTWSELTFEMLSYGLQT